MRTSGIRFQPSARIEPPLPVPMRAAVSRAARRLALAVERLHELPAGLLRHADARRGVTARLVDAVAGRGAVDAGTRLDHLLLDVAPFGRDEDLVLAAGTRERLPHDHG